uniref:C-type lectin domain-containing protein n=1 Tax=Myripristis murdjan TaxID=586833 RepID=A0A668AZU0_9TELE
HIGFLLILLTARLCSLSLCFPREYHVVEYEKNWTDAQTYCRHHYKDLATIASQEDVTMLSHALGNCQRHAWIGLYNDINSWRWSLENTSYYNEGETEFRRWKSGEPNDYSRIEDCVKFRQGKWWDDPCSKKLHFILQYCRYSLLLIGV